ncbi:hypothetical protein V5799_033941 [Amblyomma americanum]|uniref:Uncharacterized protein n=1 Tax=Amblyomma americanum TaxID=6943 RepID=A0AAQ4DLW5_AMBAM
MAPPKADPLPETAQPATQKPALLARKVKPGAEEAAQAPPQKQAQAPAPPASKPAAQAPKEAAAAGSRSPKSKGKTPQTREQMVAPEGEEAGVPDIVIPIPEEAQTASRVSTLATTEMNTAAEDDKVLNYQRLSRFRHRRFSPRGAYGFEPQQGGASLWGPDAEVPAKVKQQGGEEAPAGQSGDYIVKHYMQSPDTPLEPEVTSIKMLCIGAGVVFVIATISAWALMNIRHRGRHTTRADQYQDEYSTEWKGAIAGQRRAFLSRRSTAFLSANITVADNSPAEDGDSSSVVI